MDTDDGVPDPAWSAPFAGHSEGGRFEPDRVAAIRTGAV